MRTLLGTYFKLFIFAALLLAAIQVPGFVNQYGKNIQARLDELDLSLGHYAHDAQVYFDGDFNALVAHYLKNPDPVFQKGGKNLQKMLQRRTQLAHAHEAFLHQPWQAYRHVLLEPIGSVRQQVWQQYDFAVILNKNTLYFGLGAAVGAMFLLELLVLLLRWAVFGSRKKPPQTFSYR